jgi:hypothetical protein
MISMGNLGQGFDASRSDNRMVRWSDLSATMSFTEEPVNDLFFIYLHTLTRSE